MIRPGEMLGPYCVGRLLGRGAHSEVFEARHRGDGGEVALKVYAPTGREAGFLRESAVAFGRRHPNLIAAHSVGYGAGQKSWIALDLARGGSLRTTTDSGPTPERKCRHILLQACRATSELHKRGIVHGDIKPDNILLATQDEYPPILVADYGTSGVPMSDDEVRGTPAYMAPEAVLGCVGPLGDVYSLAVVAYELLTGRRDVEAVFYDDCPLPEPTRAALAAALAADPKDRTPSALRLAWDLDVALSTETIPPERPFGGATRPYTSVDQASAHYLVMKSENVELRGPSGLVQAIPIQNAESASLSLSSTVRYVIAAEDMLHTGARSKRSIPGPLHVNILRFAGTAMYASGTGAIGDMVGDDPRLLLGKPLASIGSFFSVTGDTACAISSDGQSVVVLDGEALPRVVSVPERIAAVSAGTHSMTLTDFTGRELRMESTLA